MIRPAHPIQFQMVMEEVTDPREIAQARERDARFRKNLAWFEAHALEIGEAHRGKHICVAGEELFVGDTPEEVFGKARAAHPEDDGYFLKYVYRERMVRIYAHQRPMDAGR